MVTRLSLQRVSCLLAFHGQQQEGWCGIVSVGVSGVVIFVQEDNVVLSRRVPVVDWIHNPMCAGPWTCRGVL